MVHISESCFKATYYTCILSLSLFQSTSLLAAVTTTVISSQKKKKHLFSKELYTFIIQNFVYTSFASQKFVYASLKSVSFLKMGLIWVFSCQNFDGSIILSYTKDSVSTS